MGCGLWIVGLERSMRTADYTSRGFYSGLGLWSVYWRKVKKVRAI